MPSDITDIHNYIKADNLKTNDVNIVHELVRRDTLLTCGKSKTNVDYLTYCRKSPL